MPKPWKVSSGRFSPSSAFPIRIRIAAPKRTGSGWTEMPDSDPIQDNPRDTPNLPAVVKEGEVLRPAADNWLLRAIRTLFGWRAGSVRADLQVVLDASTPDDVGFSAIERTMLRHIPRPTQRRT